MMFCLLLNILLLLLRFLFLSFFKEGKGVHVTDLKLCVCVSHCLVCEIVSVFVCVCFQLCQFVIEAH